MECSYPFCWRFKLIWNRYAFGCFFLAKNIWLTMHRNSILKLRQKSTQNSTNCVSGAQNARKINWFTKLSIERFCPFFYELIRYWISIFDDRMVKVLNEILWMKMRFIECLTVNIVEWNWNFIGKTKARYQPCCEIMSWKDSFKRGIIDFKPINVDKGSVKVTQSFIRFTEQIRSR